MERRQANEKIKEALSAACGNALAPHEIKVEKAPAFAAGFDLAAPMGFMLAKLKGKPPLECAKEVCAQLQKDAPAWLQIAEPKAPGFVNLKLKIGALEEEAEKALAEGVSYPQGVPWRKYGIPQSILLEYCSANPTGPLHFGHARGAILGDTLARIYRHTGNRAHREYYINDVGGQIEKLGASFAIRFKQEVLKDASAVMPEDGYPGDYLKDLAAELPSSASSWSAQQFSDSAKKEILEMIKKELASIGVEFDKYYPESSLHGAGLVSGVTEELDKKGFTAQQDGAVFFKAKDLSEEDKDRVLRRSNGQPTYFASDLAYHREKFKNNADLYINIWGADHHGYIPRLRLGMEALGLPVSKFQVILIQMVRLMREGKPVTLSKRGGDYMTLGEIAQEVGVDALRYFLNNRTPNAQLDFDLDLAKKKTAENPVYLIQYAHARICSIYREKVNRGIAWPQEKSASHSAWMEDDDKTRSLAVTLSFFGHALSESMVYQSAHHLTGYLNELAREFHGYYETHPILSESDPAKAHGRYRMCQAAASVLKTGLSLLGISAPEQM